MKKLIKNILRMKWNDAKEKASELKERVKDAVAYDVSEDLKTAANFTSQMSDEAYKNYIIHEYNIAQDWLSSCGVPTHHEGEDNYRYSLLGRIVYALKAFEPKESQKQIPS